MTEPSPEPIARPRIVGRYALFDEIAAGGMATVHIGRLVGQVGFSRTVAVKRLHPQYAKDQEFVSMFVDEARLASRIQHPNVVSTLDVVKTRDELFLVMEYVPGEALSKLVRNAAKRGERIPPNIVTSVMSGMLHGLHAAHEAKSETREPLNLVHRDISPQNVLVGTDGVARVLDFGVAKAAMRSGATRDGQMKGKLSYMSPEQLNGKEIDRRSDIFAAGVVLWEALAGKRLFAGADAGEILGKVLATDIPTPQSIVPTLSNEINAVVMKALERDPEVRYQTARELAVALEQAGPLATSHNVGEWVKDFGGEELVTRANLVTDIESHPMEDLEDRQSGIEQAAHRELQGDNLTEVGAAALDRKPVPSRGFSILLGGAVLLLGMVGGALLIERFQPLGTVRVEGPLPRTAASGFAQETQPPAASVAPPVVTAALAPTDAGTGAAASMAAPSELTASARPAVSVALLPSAAPVTNFGGGRRPGGTPGRANCNPPYTIDSTGIKKPKPQCLKQ